MVTTVKTRASLGYSYEAYFTTFFLPTKTLSLRVIVFLLFFAVVLALIDNAGIFIFFIISLKVAQQGQKSKQHVIRFYKSGKWSNASRNDTGKKNGKSIKR